MVKVSSIVERQNIVYTLEIRKTHLTTESKGPIT